MVVQLPIQPIVMPLFTSTANGSVPPTGTPTGKVLTDSGAWGTMPGPTGVVNVKDFGAKGDGITDDAAAIQAAATAAANGTLLFPAKATYLLGTPIYLSTGTTVLAYGATIVPKSTIASLPNSSNPALGSNLGPVMFTNVNWQATTLTDQNIRFFGGILGPLASGLACHGIFLRMVTNTHIADVSAQYLNSAVAHLACRNTLVESCYFSNCLNCGADHWDGPANATVRDCEIRGGGSMPYGSLFNTDSTVTGHSSGVASGCLIENVRVYGCTTGIYIGPLVGGLILTDAHVKNCYINGGTQGVVYHAVTGGSIVGTTIDGVTNPVVVLLQGTAAYPSSNISVTGNIIQNCTTPSNQYLVVTGPHMLVANNRSINSTCYAALMVDDPTTIVFPNDMSGYSFAYLINQHPAGGATTPALELDANTTNHRWNFVNDVSIGGVATVGAQLIVQTNPVVSGSTQAQSFYTNTNASGTTTKTGQPLWNMFLTTDAVQASSANSVANVGNYYTLQGSYGPRLAQQISMVINGNTNDVVGSARYMQAMGCSISANGTVGGNSGTHAGAIFGANITSTLGANAKYLVSVVGLEVDVACQTGSSFDYKYGVSAVLQNADAVDSSFPSAGLSVGLSSDSPSSPGWRYGLAFGGPLGWWPINPTSGVLIYADPNAQSGGPAHTAASGIDFSAVTFSTAFLKSNGFLVDGAGNTTTSGTLSVAGAVSGAGFTTRFAAPGPIGNTTPSTGAFTNLTATGTVAVPARSIGYAALPASAQQLPISFPFAGRPYSNAMVNVPMAVAITVPAALVGTMVYDAIKTTANAVFTLNKISGGTTTALGTVTITATSNTSVNLAGAGGSLAAGDVLQIVAPATQDVTLSDLGITILVSKV